MRAGFAYFSTVLLTAFALSAGATPTEQQQIEINHCTIMSKAVLEFAKARDQGQAKMDAYNSVTHGQEYKPGSMVDQTLQWAYEHTDESAEAASAHFYGHCSLDALEALTPQTEEQAKSAAATCQQQNAARPDETRICMDDKISALIAAANTPPSALSPVAPAPAQSQALASVQAPSAPTAPTQVVAPAPEVAQVEAPAPTQTPAVTESPVPMQIPAPVRAKPAVPAVTPAPTLAQTTLPTSAPTPVAAPKLAPMAVPTAQPTETPAPEVAQSSAPLPTPEPTPVQAPAPAPVAPAPAPAPVVAKAPEPAAGTAVAVSALAVKTAEPTKVAAAVPAATAAEPKLAVLSPPSLASIGKLQLGMAMSDAEHTFHSFGDMDRDEFGAETQTFLISDGHGYVVLLTQKGKPDTLYGIEYHGGADADTAPAIMGVRLGQGALAVLTHVGEPSRRERLPNSEFTRWYYDGRNYSFDISSGGDLVAIRLYGYEGLQSPDTDSDAPAPATTP